MDEKIIEEIVVAVFEKAKKEHASHSKFALSNHISSKTNLSSRTLERLYDRYIQNNELHGSPNAVSIDILCKYLNFENFGGYIESNPVESIGKTPAKIKGVKQKSIITISVVFGLVLMTFGIHKWEANQQNGHLRQVECMTWADSMYVLTSCDKAPFSSHGTKVVPLDRTKLENMKKVEVDAAYKFFANADEPLVWYYKKRNKEIEYFTAPGLHPTNGETLRKITQHIIETYVPLHINKEDSFIE